MKSRSEQIHVNFSIFGANWRITSRKVAATASIVHARKFWQAPLDPILVPLGPSSLCKIDFPIFFSLSMIAILGCDSHSQTGLARKRTHNTQYTHVLSLFQCRKHSKSESKLMTVMRCDLLEVGDNLVGVFRRRHHGCLALTCKFLANYRSNYRL